jgi:hypothetical protein
MTAHGTRGPEEPQDVSLDERMQRLERRARVVRSRFLRAVDALDARRHQVVRATKRAKGMAYNAAFGALAFVVLLGVGVYVAGKALKMRRGHRIGLRLERAVKALVPVRRPSEPPLVRRLFERLTLSVLSIVAGEVAKRASKNALDGRFIDGRLAAGRALRASRDDRIGVLEVKGAG